MGELTRLRLHPSTERPHNWALYLAQLRARRRKRGEDIWTLMDTRRGTVKMTSSMTAKPREAEMWAPLQNGATKRIVITVPAPTAGILNIGEDCCGLGPNNFVIERIGGQFTDDNGWLMVDVTLAERM